MSGAGIDSNAAVTSPGTQRAFNVSGNITNTPVVNVTTSASSIFSGTMNGISSLISISSTASNTFGAINASGSTLAITSQSQGLNSFTGLVTGTGTTALTITDSVGVFDYTGSTPSFNFSGGIMGVSSITYITPNANILNPGSANPTGTSSGSLIIGGTTAVSGLSTINISNVSLNLISAPLTLGSSFAVSESNSGPLNITGNITGNGSTAISFVAPLLTGSLTGAGTGSLAQGNVIKTGTISSIASISNDGASPC